MKIAIIGLGVIGQSQLGLFGPHVHETYDIKDEKHYPRDRISECDFAVICVPTPPGEDGRADLYALWSALYDLPEGVPVMIRSTIPPGTLSLLESPEWGHVVHVPEFMYESQAGLWPQSADVPFMIIGGSASARDYFRPKLRSLFPGAIHERTGLEAELIKYTANAYLAMKVTFANEMDAICRASGANWEWVRSGWIQDPRAGSSHTEVYPPGGFGGACLPKDLAALIAASSDRGYDPQFLRAVQDANRKFRRDDA